MHAITATTLLGAWERALSQVPAQRALTLLSLVCDETPESGAAMPIGQRDAHLLDLRESAFGSRMTAQVACPACGRVLETSIEVSDVRLARAAGPDGPGRLVEGEYDMEFRLPNSADVAAIDPGLDRLANRRRLIERCVVNARCGGDAVAADGLPAEVLAELSRRMAEADLQADVQLSLTCPDCGHVWQAPLDIASYLWAELHAWAGRLLRDVHTLAFAYGWDEADILALHPQRRQAYLEMIAG